VRELIFRGHRFEKSLAGETTLAPNIHVQRRQQKSPAAKSPRPRANESGSAIAPDSRSRRRKPPPSPKVTRYSNQRIEASWWSAARALAQSPVALAACEARGSPGCSGDTVAQETDRAIQRGDEEFQKIRKAHEARRAPPAWAESARRLVSPRQQQDAHGQQEPAR